MERRGGLEGRCPMEKLLQDCFRNINTKSLYFEFKSRSRVSFLTIRKYVDRGFFSKSESFLTLKFKSDFDIF